MSSLSSSNVEDSNFGPTKIPSRMRTAFEPIFEEVRNISTFKAKYRRLGPSLLESMKERTLFVTGPPGTGKSEWATAMFPKFFVASHKEDLSRFEPHLYEGIIFDNLQPASMDMWTLLTFISCTQDKTIRLMYRTATIPKGYPRVITTNWPVDNFMAETLEIHRQQKNTAGRKRRYASAFEAKSLDYKVAEARKIIEEKSVQDTHMKIASACIRRLVVINVKENLYEDTVKTARAQTAQSLMEYNFETGEMNEVGNCVELSKDIVIKAAREKLEKLLRKKEKQGV